MGKKGKSRETTTTSSTNDDEKPVISTTTTNTVSPSSQSTSKKSQVGSSLSDAQTASNGAGNVQINGDGASHENQEEENELPAVVVNKWSLHELKMACDDALKQYYARPSLFKPSHVHTDVRLVLGWTSSLIALGASGYAYKVPFQDSRSWVLAALITFVFLSAVMAAYAKWVERDTVFIGRRKVYAGRIETQTITVRSSCAPYTPIYDLHLSFHHSSNGGKTLIRTSEKTLHLPFNEVFDEGGKLVRGKLESALRRLLDEAVGA